MLQPSVWAQKTVAEVLTDLGSFEQGLKATHVAKRQSECGSNILPRPARSSVLNLLLQQFKNPLILILMGAAVITWILADYVDLIVILMAVLVNAGIGFFQEFKANRAFYALEQYIEHRARVIRDGTESLVPTETLVPGDIIEIRAGERVPADARVIWSRGGKVDESGLTGEWLATEKVASVLPASRALGDLRNLVFMGTAVTEGAIEGVVFAIGGLTQFGLIAQEVSESRSSLTPLQEQVARLGRNIWRLMGVISLAIIAVGVWRAESWASMVVVAVALAVAAVPEGLPAAMSAVLAMSMRRLLAKRGLVRQMIAAETLGAADYICTDKTGTLTEGTMSVSKIVTLHPATHHVSENLIRRMMLLCNDAAVENPEASPGKWRLNGSPTDRALLLSGLKSSLDPKIEHRKAPLLTRLPFTSQRKFQATFHQQGKIALLLAVGAPERLAARTSHFLAGRRQVLRTKTRLNNTMEHLAGEGYRVLGFAFRELPLASVKAAKDEAALDKLVTKLTFVGFAALSDPIRPEAVAAMAEARAAGIKTIMVTGDHRLTAEAVGRKLGFRMDGPNAVMEGQVLAALPDDDLAETAEQVKIFARVSPQDKLRIINALHAKGHVVAMTGDGINDAPALKRADIGVAVGSGTDVAKEVSDLVLLDNNFATIVAAVREGRVAFSNMRKVLIYLLSNSLSEVVLVVGSLILNIPMAILPAQILWINLVDDGLPNFALAFEPGDKSVMRLRPRPRHASILDKGLSPLLIFLSSATALLLFGTYYFLTIRGFYDLTTNRSIVFASLGLISLVTLLALKSFEKPFWRLNLLLNPYLLWAVVFGFSMILAGLYIPALNEILGTSPVGLNAWVIIIALASVTLILIEGAKKVIAVKAL